MTTKKQYGRFWEPGTIADLIFKDFDRNLTLYNAIQEDGKNRCDVYMFPNYSFSCHPFFVAEYKLTKKDERAQLRAIRQRVRKYGKGAPL